MIFYKKLLVYFILGCLFQGAISQLGYGEICTIEEEDDGTTITTEIPSTDYERTEPSPSTDYEIISTTENDLSSTDPSDSTGSTDFTTEFTAFTDMYLNPLDDTELLSRDEDQIISRARRELRKSQYRAIEYCDPGAWLHCDSQEEKCLCRPLPSQYFNGTILKYDETQRKCVSSLGEECMENWSQYPGVFCEEPNKVSCVQSGFDVIGICECKVGLSKGPDNKCRISHGSNVKCQNSTECNFFQHLICNPANSYCECNAANSVWDPIQNTCISFLNGKCSDYGDEDYKQRCYHNMECGNKKECICKEGYMEFTDHCRAGFSTTCNVEGNPEENCHTNFHCTNSTCSCLTGHTYIPAAQECKILAGQPCSETSNACISRADCVEGTCLCKPEFNQTADGHCIGKWGFDCTTNRDCDYGSNLVCDESQTPHKCNCNTNYTYNRAEDVCLGLFGADCRSNTDCSESDNLQCEEGESTCNCIEGFSQKSVGDVCLPHYGSTCNENTQNCVEGKFLKCQLENEDHICRCESNGMVHDRLDLTRCVSHGACDLYALPNITKLECVENASCIGKIENGNDNKGVCTCNPGLVFEVGRRRCIAGSSSNLVNLLKFTILMLFIPFLF